MDWKQVPSAKIVLLRKKIIGLEKRGMIVGDVASVVGLRPTRQPLGITGIPLSCELV
jgi:hypothetical protein